jgi:hypothetical protein
VLIPLTERKKENEQITEEKKKHIKPIISKRIEKIIRWSSFGNCQLIWFISGN